MGLETSFRGNAFKNIIISMTGDKYPNISVLDLASGGNCAVKDLILEGIDYTAVEIRKENVDLISKQLSHLPNAKVILGDVRRVDELNLGKFDIVIIAGLFYHLSPEDYLKVLTKTLVLATAGVIIDTVFASEKVTENKYFELDGYIYEGRAYYEHLPTDKSVLINSRLRASFQNEGKRYLSFAMTEDSLVRLLRKLGCQMISRYKYSPGINEAPIRPPKTGDQGKPWTALMNSERGILTVYLNSKLVKKDTNLGYFQFSKGEGQYGDISNKQLDEVKERLYNLIVKNIKSNANETNFNLSEIIHNAGRMLPLSLHNVIIEAGIRAKMKLSDIVTLRIYAESYLKTVNILKEKHANQFINSYLKYLCSFDVSWAISMATTFRNYLSNFLPTSTRHIVLNWVDKKAKVPKIFRRLRKCI